MEIEEIVGLAKRDRAGRTLADKFTQDSSINAVQALAAIDGKLNDPELADLLSYAPDMTPARQRTCLEDSLSSYTQNLTNAVLENTENVVKSLADKESLGLYLLSNSLKPAVYGDISDEWVKNYASAREAFMFLNNSEKDMPKKVDGFVKEQINYLKSKSVSSGVIAGLIWVYGNHPELAQNRVLVKSREKVQKFVDELDVNKGRAYILDRMNALEGKAKSAEAYNLGQSLAK